MNLLIHDLSPEQWERIKPSYAGWHVISDDGRIRPCSGCFSCWNRTPGRCVIRDGYDDIGVLIHRAGEVVVISRYTYGGFSGFVKNVFDRCIGYALPQFEIVGGETHHRKRYDEDKPYTFVFYGHDLSEGERESARRYAAAVCANTRGHVKGVRFEESPQGDPPGDCAPSVPSGRVVLLNGSMRAERGNSAELARRLADRLHRDHESVDLKDHIGDLAKLPPALADATDVVLCTPLYVDGLPSQVVRFMEAAQRARAGGPKRIYVLANMGLYESRQLANLFEAVRQWCGATGHAYCGGLGVSAGELIGVLLRHPPLGAVFTRNVAGGIRRLAKAIDAGAAAGEILAEPFCFPRRLYIRIANQGWKRMAKANGIRAEGLYRRP